MTSDSVIDVKVCNVSDSWALKKLQGTSGHGEAKLYVGSRNDENEQFFSNTNAFIKRSNILSYLNDSRFEYEYQEQNYRRDISSDWQSLYDEVMSLQDIIHFEFDLPEAGGSRLYINSAAEVYSTIRRVVLPLISRIRILQWNRKGLEFTLELDHIYGQYEHPQREINESSELEETEREQVILARKGQGRFRDVLLAEGAKCLFTGIDDERLLVAGHIKPWSESNSQERLSRENGILLIPTYDRLFDRGFISFADNGLLLVSNHLSPKNINRLGLCDSNSYGTENYWRDRRNNLEFHRENIFMCS